MAIKDNVMSSIGFCSRLQYTDIAKGTTNNFFKAAEDYFSPLCGRTYTVTGRYIDWKHGAYLVKNPKSGNCALTALKVASYITIILPLIMLVAKIIHRCNHSFKVFEPIKPATPNALAQAELVLNAQITLPDDYPNKIGLAAATVIHYTNNDLQHSAAPTRQYDIDVKTWVEANINLFNSNQRNHVFSYKDNPDIIYKVASVYNTDTRYRNMIVAQEYCTRLKLDRLVVPGARKFEISTNQNNTRYGVIAEKRMDIGPATEFNNNYTRLKGNQEAVETIRQMTKFILLSGLYDIIPDNIPLIIAEDSPPNSPYALAA